MKLILQIALGVFLGALASQLSVDAWRTHRDEAAREVALKIRAENEARVRALLTQGREVHSPKVNNIFSGFIPEDVQAETSRNQ